MNYSSIYNRIIEKAESEIRCKGADIYYERHHIVPKCMGGNNSKTNLVYLTAKEHYICHKLLCAIYPDNIKLKYAFWRMINIKRTNRANAYRVSANEYNVIRSFIQQQNSLYSHSNETKIKMSLAKLGKKYDEIYGDNAQNMRQQRSIENKGRKHNTHSEQTRQKISQSTKGRNKGKTYEEMYGPEKAAELRASRRLTNLTRSIKGNPKGKSLADIFGSDKAAQIIEKRIQTRNINKYGRERLIQ